MPKPNGVMIYDGPSEYTGERIIVVVVGLKTRSTNSKTGGMVQTYVFPAGVDPVTAWKTGADTANCGACIHRSPASGGLGTCYVAKFHGPAAVYSGWKRGIYPTVAPAEAAELVRETGRALRLGTWGDPAAVPAGVLDVLAMGASERTGYTHGWRDRPDLRGLVMASVDSVAETREAQAAGFATFRVAPHGDAGRLPGEARCPASAEAGKRVTCETCPLKCDGAVSRGVFGRVIQDHGPRRHRGLLSA